MTKLVKRHSVELNLVVDDKSLNYWICLNEDMHDVIDRYEYHDAPDSITIYLTKEDLLRLRAKMDEILGVIAEVENGKSVRNSS